MGEREWMHETDTAGSVGSRMVRRFSTTQWLSGTKFVRLVVGIAVVGVIALLAAAQWG